MGIEELISEEFANNPAAQQTQAFVEELRQRIDEVKAKDTKVTEYVKEKRRRDANVDSLLIRISLNSW